MAKSCWWNVKKYYFEPSKHQTLAALEKLVIQNLMFKGGFDCKTYYYHSVALRFYWCLFRPKSANRAYSFDHYCITNLEIEISLQIKKNFAKKESSCQVTIPSQLSFMLRLSKMFIFISIGRQFQALLDNENCHTACHLKR